MILVFYDVALPAALMVLVWLTVVLHKQRNAARRALLGAVALLPTYDGWRGRWEWLQPGDLDDGEIRLRLDRVDAVLGNDQPESAP